MIPRRASQHKAQSLVELTLFITILLFLLLAMIDFGFAYLYWITIRDAAQEGATYGSIHPGVGCENDVRNWVRGAASSSLIDLTVIPDNQIVITHVGFTPGSTIKVEVIVYYHILTPIVSNVIGTPNVLVKANITNVVLNQDPACP